MMSQYSTYLIAGARPVIQNMRTTFCRALIVSETVILLEIQCKIRHMEQLFEHCFSKNYFSD